MEVMTEGIKPKLKIALITADLSSGGAERVISTLANEFAHINNVEVHLICLIQGNSFYQIDSRVIIHKPNFNYKEYKKTVAYLKTIFYLRKKLKSIQPKSYLSFGGRYNALCILSGLGLKTKVFVSDRSRPGISYGKLQDYLNKLLYPYADGIVAQTSQSKEFHLSKFNHKNIRVIGNPIPILKDVYSSKKNVILNVGRFISSKNQSLLIKIFEEINPKDWELWFVGEGEFFDKCKEQAKNSLVSDKIIFWGNQSVVSKFYNQSKIFAFTSTSEGFPNALGEAMGCGLSCISFDCIAGPADIIENDVNGYLIENMNISNYSEKLSKLIFNEKIRENFNKSSSKITQKFSKEKIVSDYFNFIIE